MVRLLTLLSLAILLAGCRPSASPPPVFTSVPGSESGLQFRFRLPGKRPLTILGTIGHGVGFLDYDGDGNLDVLLVDRRPALFRGDGTGKFTDVTAFTLGNYGGHFLGCAVGDYDNDGDPDVYLSGYSAGRLLRNEAGRTFTDVSGQAGITPQPWGASASWVDLDRDGRLDLVVGNYVEFGPRHRQYCSNGQTGLACPPSQYFGLHPAVYGNRGGRFEEMGKAWKVQQASSGKTLGVAAADVDNSGQSSVYLANDMTPGNLLQLKSNRLADDATQGGVAYALSGAQHAGMGVDWGDFDNDGWLDLAVATYAGEVKPVYHNQGDRLWEDKSDRLGIAAPLLPYLSFGVKWLDADNDGWLDLVYTNGHTADNIAQAQPDQTFRQPSLLLQNRASGLGRSFAPVALADLNRPIVGRGVASGDFDNDGRVDLLIADSDGEPVLLRNETTGAHWLGVRLVGNRRSGRDAYGATVTLEAGGRRQTRHCHADGGYLSSSDPRVHFGLGDADRVQRLTIHWPSGQTTTLGPLQPDRYVTVEEP